MADLQKQQMAQINEMINKWRNKREDNLDYKKQLVNENGNQDVDRIMVENINRIQTIISNRFWYYWL